MLCVEDLVNIDPFQRLPQERLEWVCDRAQTVERRVGEILVREGDVSCGVFILVAGQISITRRSDGSELPVGQHEAPSFLGEITALTDEPVTVSIRAARDCRIYKIEPERER